MSDFTDRVERFSLGEHAYGCECSGCTPLAISHASTIDTLCAERDAARDELAAVLAKGDGAAQAQLAATLDALERLVWAFPELTSSIATMPQQRALNAARALLADNGRGLP